ncbi:MAG: hypothetical protein E6Q50_06260 [Lysobacter sp.]|nr:MAG: hypothetical protein E6Q50_06260 [Lysobacter sp.]
MVTQRTAPAPGRFVLRPAFRTAADAHRDGARRPPSAWRWLLALALCGLLNACASTQVRTAKTDDGAPLVVGGSVVMVEPDIELYEVLAGGAQEPRKAWTETARRLYPQMARALLAERGIEVKPDFSLPPDTGADDRLRQLYLLNQAVSISVLQYGRSTASSGLRNKRGKFDWTLGPGVSVLRDATGADYALFTYIRDSYTSGGRAAMRIIGFVLLGGDIGGGYQIGLASLVDLRTGQVVWHNLLVDQAGDLRDDAGARETAGDLLKGLGPKPPPKSKSARGQP